MHTILSSLLIGLAPLVYATCECGYKTNTNELFQYALLTDFSSTNLSSFEASPDWEITTITYGQSDSRPYATEYTPANVNVTNGSLVLTCSAATTSSVPSAQIQTSRYDILHGSFRAQYKIESASTGAGAISGFFFYANDTAEVDIELLTRDNAREVVFTNQPDASSSLYMPNKATQAELNNYRFDWTSSNTTFYVNNVLSDSKTEDVPSTNGSIYLNMWGGSTYAGNPPPSTDAKMLVSAIQLYFNTSDASLAKSWAQTCASKKTAVCSVDSQALQKNATSTGTAAAATTKSGGSASGGKADASDKKNKTHRLMRYAAVAGAALLNLDG